MNNDEYQICVNVGNAPFFYKGKIIRETTEFLVVKDRKIGEVEVSKSAIVSKQRLNEVQR